MRIRNRTILPLILPGTVFLFTVGWLLYCFGDRSKALPVQRKQSQTKDNGIQIRVAAPEESQQYNE